MTIQVIGLGYIGLPTAAMFASVGQDVLGVDVNEQAVVALNAGKPHIFEPGLDELVQQVVADGRLRAVGVPEAADAFIIAVPTPFKLDHEPDLAYVEAAARSIAPVLKSGDLVVLESTSPVGTTDRLCGWLQDERPDLRFPVEGDLSESDIAIAYCPERVLPGRILDELRSNDRILGGITPACARAASELYGLFVEGQCRVTNARTAELAKLSENAYRDVNIAFANELSLIADRLDIEVWELIDLANLHPRVNILSPGPGVGGHCIAVDPWFIVHSAPNDVELIPAARAVNNRKPLWVVDKVRAAMSELDSPTVACLGLAYKPDIDDLRESPAIEVVRQLASDAGSVVLVVEPNVDVLPANLELDNVVMHDLPSAIAAADIVVGLVAHREFVLLDPSEFEGCPVVDAVGMWK